MRPITSSFTLASVVALAAIACTSSDKPTSPLAPGTSLKSSGVPTTGYGTLKDKTKITAADEIEK